MSEFLVEPVKMMLDKACEAASTLLRESDPDGIDHRIELIEYRIDDTLTLYLKYNGDIAYKRIWTAENGFDVNDARAVLYGAFLTEAIACFAVISIQAQKVRSNK